MQRETRYAKSGDVNIAYQVVGQGPLDLVFVMGWVSHLDWFWEEPRFAHFLHRLASFSRLILFDKRGTGLSDRAVGLPTLEERMDDVRAVMDEVGSERAALLGISEGGPMCALFAATYPERTRALVLLASFARQLVAPDYPWGDTLEERLRLVDHVERNWGSDVRISARAPSLVQDERFREWWATYLRMSASPGAAAALIRMNMAIDVRHVLPTICVPALIIHRTGDRSFPIGAGRYLAQHIPHARFVELPGDDHLPFVGDQDAILDEIEQFLTGARPAPLADRVLATLLVTEVVGAAEAAARLGDGEWQCVLAAYNDLVRDQVGRFRGREVRQTVNGVMAAFDGPARAIGCACAIVAGARPLGLTVRAGLHTGECEAVGRDLTGAAVQVVARVLARSTPGEVLVSSTVKDLVAGSGIEFADVDLRLLGGAGGAWHLYRVRGGSASGGGTAAGTGPMEAAIDREAARLSRREREVAVLVAQGRFNREIASELAISVATAERHVANIMNKLGYHTRAQVAAWTVEHGLLSDRAD
jgi:pimeloyl-ACP methyl ester carboxylesterase/class 3 adenylate cyclase/DNA-binding CsgD family transcriptional regulator